MSAAHRGPTGELCTSAALRTSWPCRGGLHRTPGGELRARTMALRGKSRIESTTSTSHAAVNLNTSTHGGRHTESTTIALGHVSFKRA